MESGCALFAALREEDLIYSQPKNQLTLNLSFELKPEETFLSRNLGLGQGRRHYQLDSYQRRSTGSPSRGSLLCWECWVLGFHQASRRIKRLAVSRGHPTSA